MQLSLFPEAGFTAHRSAHDASVNWDRPADVGRLEARYVRRCPDYFVVYLSSQTGCAQGCRMCHLTATGQTRLRDATADEMVEQARTVLDHYRREAPPARRVHFNFMARGEPLANRALLSDADGLLYTFPGVVSHLVDFLRRPLISVSTRWRTVWK
jgi:23S rRNA (adenine2503-C2)-methyltransferase